MTIKQELTKKLEELEDAYKHIGIHVYEQPNTSAMITEFTRDKKKIEYVIIIRKK